VGRVGLAAAGHSAFRTEQLGFAGATKPPP
jgi:hypothetical protein